MARIKEQLRADLTTAMKTRDEVAKSVIRMALAAIQYKEVSFDEARQLTDEEELAVITKEQRNRLESAKTYADAGRDELAAKESAEAEVLARYLPAPLTTGEVIEIVEAQIAATAAELGEAPSMKQMGAIVKAVNQQVAGRAEGKLIASLVKDRLS
ncbi:hypothetical protein HMPREF1531_02485 [Propionibacterium sp. oral taxon 192 str. F0372]|uniref:GatB/YqeY domain-containing protein n=1 Tax=Propionibacterium sp. oral taxon 192 TaxID=671222 RepID=UPI00035331A4|nr:GatB/YqeY domain-containing protein [Propionibacterium sp. oral taxon 192]EPH00377.1 hypothetical protein HMPREF1531_02485 [Propionibacterium sp. oral taxon 192 str. F0372]